jgi:hypothetical protein
MFFLYEAESDLNAREAIDALTASVSHGRWFRVPETPFVGKVSETGFCIARAVRGRDSFNPMLYGRIARSANVTRVWVLMTLHPIAWVFLIAWSVFLVGQIVIHGNSEPECWAFVVAPWVLAVPFSFHGAYRSRGLLKQCLRLHNPK